MSKKSTQKLIIILSVTVVVLFVILFVQKTDVVQKIERQNNFEEIVALGDSFKDLSIYFTELAQNEGGVYAFSVLLEAPLPPNIDLHLLGHIVGDELYKQEGLDGMQYCTPDFRNACSHTIVIGALLETGDGVFDEINEVCKKAPGGRGAYTMCFHGFGHGVLAFNDYEVPDAVEMCKRVGTEPYRNREYVECVGGMVMEMVSGIHDRDVWEEKAKIYLADDNPLYLCSSDFIPEDSKAICYTYISPELFEAAGANQRSPTADDFSKAFEYCDTLDEGDMVGRNACYGGLGKEFVVLVQDRDIRDLSTMSDEQLETVTRWCDLAEYDLGIKACMSNALNSLYWGGENPIELPLRFCSLVSDNSMQNHCMNDLMNAASFYAPQGEYRETFCANLPEKYTQTCKKKLL